MSWCKRKATPRTRQLTVLLFAAVATPMLDAQVPAPVPSGHSLQLGRGFWLDAGLGYASVDACERGCAMGAPTGELAGGVWLGQKFRLGLGLRGWTKGDEIIRLTVGSADLRVRYYPTETAGFFFAGGAGLGMIRLSPGPESQGNAVTRWGRALIAGVGCDFHVSPTLSITPFADLDAVRTAGPNVLSADVWQLGLALTLH